MTNAAKIVTMKRSTIDHASQRTYREGKTVAHPAVREHHLASIRTAVEKAKGAKSIPHKGLRGRVREIFVGDLLKPLLPPTFGVGTGLIIDSKGASSAECDV